jgi:hypothetical protein
MGMLHLTGIVRDSSAFAEVATNRNPGRCAKQSILKYAQPVIKSMTYVLVW